MLSTTENCVSGPQCVHVRLVTLTINTDVLLNISKQLDFWYSLGVFTERLDLNFYISYR